jgi:HlyD family secretion protein
MYSGRKRIIGKAAAAFIGIMLLLTFFSNTINNYLSPRVTWENPESGPLVKEISGTGRVRAKTALDRYTSSNMKVLQVAVKVGETVKKGQLLLSLDTTEIEEQLANERTIWQQKKLNVEKFEDEASVEGMRSYDNAIEAASLKLEDAERNLENIKELYKFGAETAANVKKSEIDLKNAQMEYQKSLDNKTLAERNSMRNLQNARHELDIQERKLRELEKELELAQVTAPEDGTIIELNFPGGTIANNSKPLFKLADTSGGFEFRTSIDIDSANLLSPGETAEVFLDSFEGYSFEGTIDSISDSQEEMGVKKEVIITIPTENLIGGESGSAVIKKRTKTYDVLVQNSAVGQDMSGYFVYVVNEKKGPLGSELYAQKVKVSAGDSDYSMTAILSGLGSYDRVITGSDKQLSDGMRVTVEDN